MRVFTSQPSVPRGRRRGAVQRGLPTVVAERLGNYVPTVLDERYDAFLYCDRTEALHPLHATEEPDPEPETFPSGQ